MKFTTALSAAALSTFASAATLQLKASIKTAGTASDYRLYDIHEGAALNYVLAGEQGSTYSYDSDKGLIYHTLATSGGDYNLTLDFNDYSLAYPQLQFSAADEPKVKWSIGDDKTLKGNVNGAEIQFYAGKNTGDPYGYSKEIYSIGATYKDITDYDVHAVESLQPITVTVVDYSE